MEPLELGSLDELAPDGWRESRKDRKTAENPTPYTGRTRHGAILLAGSEYTPRCGPEQSALFLKVVAGRPASHWIRTGETTTRCRGGSTARRNRRTGRLSRWCWRPWPSAYTHSRRLNNCRKFCRPGSYSRTSSAKARRLRCKFAHRGE